MVATEVHRRLVSDCDGCSEWQALAGGGYWRGAGGGRHPCARAKSIRGWQDLCAVHDLRASGGENAPWWQDVRAAYSPTALCGAFWIHSTHILPKVAESEYMAAIYCHELVFSCPRPLRERIGAISRHGHVPDDRHRSSSTAYLRP